MCWHQSVALCTLGYMCIFKLQCCLGSCLGAGLQDLMATLFVVLRNLPLHCSMWGYTHLCCCRQGQGSLGLPALFQWSVSASAFVPELHAGFVVEFSLGIVCFLMLLYSRVGRLYACIWPLVLGFSPSLGLHRALHTNYSRLPLVVCLYMVSVVYICQLTSHFTEIFDF